MNILNRRMFQEGGEATPSFSIVDPGKKGSYFGGSQYLGVVPKTTRSETFDIVQDDTGQFYADDGQFLIPIDMRYGNTPREALKNEEMEKGIQSLVNRGITAASLIALKRPITSTSKGIGGMFYKPKPKGVDFVITPAGIEVATSKLTPLSKTLLTGAGLGGAYLSGDVLADAAVTTPDEEVEMQTTDDIAESLNELSSQPSIKTSTEVAEETSTEPSVEVKNSKVTTEEDEDEVGKIIEGETTPPKNYQASFLGNPNFIGLLRNLSKGLATSETMYEGLALGAAGAAEERFLTEQAEIKRLADLKAAEGKSFEEIQEFILKEKIKNIPTKKEQADAKVQLAEFADAYAEADTSEQLFNNVLEIASKEDITGLGPVASSLFKEYIQRPLGGKVPLTARERAIKILEQIANGQIKTITGESGRTISNNDRLIAKELVGNLKNPLVSVEDVMARISLQLTTVAQRKKKAKDQYDAYATFFTENGLQIPIQLTTDKIDTSFGLPQAGRVRIKLPPKQ